MSMDYTMVMEKVETELLFKNEERIGEICAVCGYDNQLHHYEGKAYCIYCLANNRDISVITQQKIREYGAGYIRMNPREFYLDYLYRNLGEQEKIQFVRQGFAQLQEPEKQALIADFIAGDTIQFARYLAHQPGSWTH